MDMIKELSYPYYLSSYAKPSFGQYKAQAPPPLWPSILKRWSILIRVLSEWREIIGCIDRTAWETL